MIIVEDKVNFQFPVDKRGKITSGIKGSKDQKGKKSLDYFRCDDFEEVIAAYGSKPKKLIIFFPPGKIENFFQYYYCEWGLNHRAKRRCNQEVFTVTYDQYDEVSKSNLKKNTEYECQFPKCQCKTNLYFTCFIANPNTGKILNSYGKTYLFRSGSKQNANKILTLLRMNEQHLWGQPFALTCEWIVSGDQAYPSWDIEALPHLDKTIKLSYGNMLELEDNSNLLASGNKDEQDEKFPMLNESADVNQDVNMDEYLDENDEAIKDASLRTDPDELIMKEIDRTLSNTVSAENIDKAKTIVRDAYTRLTKDVNKAKVVHWVKNMENRLVKDKEPF